MGGQELRIFESSPPLLTFSSSFGQFGRNNFGGGNSGPPPESLVPLCATSIVSGGAAFGGTSGVFGGGCSDNNQRGNGFGERRRVLGIRGRGIGRSRGSAAPRRRPVIIQ